jgi:hypothetical protein
MGNSSSTSNNKSFSNFYEIIDYIATYYILTMDFKSLSKLSDKEYCDNLVVLTSDIIQKYFNDLEVTYLEQRVKGGLDVNELKKDSIIFLNKDQLENLDIQNDAQKSIKKKRVCIGIAKFYVKIAHLFAAIVMTINPTYVYKDETGNIIKTELLEKDKIPKNTKRKLYKLNICDNRIKSLKKGEEFKNSSSDIAQIHPKMCSMNLKKDGTVKNLADEPGITELMQLYLDDKYDYSNGTFTGMTSDTEKQFKKDLKTFYTTFTGIETMPPEIQKFSDIKLKNYQTKSGCQGDKPLFKQPYSISKNDKLFIKYASNIKEMIETAASKQNELLSVINNLFIFVQDPYTKKNKIRVNPKLTDESLQKDIIKARKIIIELYVNCETDYVNGLKIYEAIVEKKILETTQKQINTLQKESDKIVSETKNVIKPPAPIIEKPQIATIAPVIENRVNVPVQKIIENLDVTSTTLPNTSSLVSESQIDNNNLNQQPIQQI